MATYTHYWLTETKLPLNNFQSCRFLQNLPFCEQESYCGLLLTRHDWLVSRGSHTIRPFIWKPRRGLQTTFRHTNAGKKRHRLDDAFIYSCEPPISTTTLVRVAKATRSTPRWAPGEAISLWSGVFVHELQGLEEQLPARGGNKASKGWDGKKLTKTMGWKMF